MKKLILFFISIFSITYSFAQSTMSATADYAETSTIEIEWTIGEPFVETVSDGSNILTQGVHQSKLTNSGVGINEKENSLVNLYPNPATEYIIVDIPSNVSDKTIIITDILGKTVLITNETLISVSALTNGVYFVTLERKDKEKQIISFVKR